MFRTSGRALMLDLVVAILAGLTILAMGELCRWAWRVHDRNL